MEALPNHQAIDTIIENASQDGRTVLLEHEVYDVLEAAGLSAMPVRTLLDANVPPELGQLMRFEGRGAVLKVASPTIVHKTEVGGVRFVPGDVETIASGWSAMLQEVPRSYARWIEAHPSAAPEPYRSMSNAKLEQAIRRDVRGILVAERVPIEGDRLGGELFLGLRRTREFGPIVSAGLGGVDAELLASAFRQGVGVAMASVHQSTAAGLFELFQGTLAYRKLAGRTREGRRRIADERILRCFEIFFALGRHYSVHNPDAAFVLEEFEVNPFAASRGELVPIDGFLRFSRAPAARVPRPVHKVKNLLRPSSVAVVGVSAKGMNMGRIILRNILAAGFPKDDVYVVRPDLDELDGVRCVPTIRALPVKADLVVLAVPAPQIPPMIDELLETDRAESVILISGGLGEKEGSEALEARTKERIREAHRSAGGGPVFVGGNSLGVVSRPGRYDTLFIPESKLPKVQTTRGSNVAILSQSGAFMITRMSKLGFFAPTYGVSAGNQIDLTIGDMLTHLAPDSEVDVFAVYVEGFADGDGLAFAQAVSAARASGKDVIFYKAGRTPEGRTATTGHTASIAGDYTVSEAVVTAAGACVAQTFTEMGEFLQLASLWHGRAIGGQRIACLSNAGFEAVGMADRLHGTGYNAKLAELGEQTIARLEKVLVDNRLSGLVDVHNPLDLTPMANEDAYLGAIEAILDDPGVDVLLLGCVPLTPALQTLPAGSVATEDLASDVALPARLRQLIRSSSKPIAAVVDSGIAFVPLEQALLDAGLPTFHSADRAMWIIARFLEYSLRNGRRAATVSAS